MSTWMILRSGIPYFRSGWRRNDLLRAQLDAAKRDSATELAMALYPAGEGWRWSPQS